MGVSWESYGSLMGVSWESHGNLTFLPLTKSALNRKLSDSDGYLLVSRFCWCWDLLRIEHIGKFFEWQPPLAHENGDIWVA